MLVVIPVPAACSWFLHKFVCEPLWGWWWPRRDHLKHAHPALFATLLVADLADAMARPTAEARVLEALVNRRVTIRSDGHLELPVGLHWPGINSRVLFVRRCYVHLYEDVLNHCKATAGEEPDAKTRRQIVSGQPGIGKTLWGCVTAADPPMAPYDCAMRCMKFCSSHLIFVSVQVVRHVPRAERPA
jgi:hypothetical protein